MDMLSLLFVLISNQHGLSPGLLYSVCYVESAHNINAVHIKDGKDDSLGICQIKYKTAKFMGFKGSKQQLMEPVTNIYYAAKYLKYQQKRYKSIARGIIAYNIGNAANLTTTYYQRKVFTKWKSL
jgi:soluble lytic murein transglycosylase-like protein